MKIKPQGRPRINLLSLNKTICLRLSAWLHYVKIICSLEDHANCPSLLSHKRWLMTGVNADWTRTGGHNPVQLRSSESCRYCFLTHTGLLHRKKQPYLLYRVEPSTCGNEKQVPACPVETELHRSYRTKSGSICNHSSWRINIQSAQRS